MTLEYEICAWHTLVRTRRLVTLNNLSENDEFAADFTSAALVFLSAPLTLYRLTQRKISGELGAPYLVVWQCMP